MNSFNAYSFYLLKYKPNTFPICFQEQFIDIIIN